MTRGLTLIEMVLSIGLLSILMVITASWTGVAARMSGLTAGRHQGLAPAHAVMHLIHDAIVTGDFAPTEGAPAREGKTRRPTIRVETDRLVIMTRALDGARAGSVELALRHDAFDDTLTMVARDVRGAQQVRPLLTWVKSCSFQLESDEHRLHVSIELHSGEIIERSFRVP